LPRVDIMMFTRNASSDLLQAPVDAEAKGIVIAVAERIRPAARAGHRMPNARA
jgi:hypothetical protein